jgi:hypothetical protein
MSKGRKIIMVAAVCGGLVAAPLPADAAPVVATASGSAGSVDVTADGQHIVADAVAPCTADGPLKGGTLGGTYGNAAVFGNSDTACAHLPDGTAVGQASGHRFKTTILQQFGGPEITVRTFVSRCATTETGSSGYIEIGDVTGFTVPANIPANYTLTIPGAAPDTRPMARVVLNELVTPSPPDGSLTTNTVHIKLFPEGGPATGDIMLGTAKCNPFGKAAAPNQAALN